MQNANNTNEQLLKQLAETQARLNETDQRYRQAHAAFKSANDKYRDLFENAGDSIFIIDPQSHRIIDANANAARRFGYLHRELLQMTIDQIEILADVETRDQPVSWESVYSGARFYECHYRRKDGSLLPVEVSSCLALADKGHVLQNFVRDISHRKAIESEREQLISELDAFAHTVAHDLKSPLGLIVGYAGLLEDSLSSFSDAEALEMIAAILRGGQKMNRIIEDLLMFASTRRLDAVQPTALNMSAIIQEALARLQNLVEERRAEIDLVNIDGWPIAAGYAPWVEEVWANYISNAIKYGGTPPKLKLGASLEADNQVRFWVSDNGVGISPDEQAQLFRMFTRLGVTQIAGHGLGLSIVQRIVSRLGGTVGVQSQPGRGSEFSFTLPVNRFE